MTFYNWEQFRIYCWELIVSERQIAMKKEKRQSVQTQKLRVCMCFQQKFGVKLLMQRIIEFLNILPIFLMIKLY